MIAAGEPSAVDAAGQSYLDVAADIGRGLCQAAIWHDGRCTWLGDEYEPGRSGWQTVHRSCDHSLYGGTSGISLFLGQLALATGDPALVRAAEGSIRHALRGATRSADAPGLYEGAGGAALAAAWLGRLLERERLVDAAGELADRMVEAALGTRPHGASELIRGTAGTLVALLALVRPLARPGLLDACRALGDRLLAEARRTPYGWSWPQPEHGIDRALCGLAHGGSGVAWALLELNAACGEPRYLHAAREATRYERGWFDRARCNWPDLRVAQADAADVPGRDHPAYWCHGAVGVGLVRLREHRLTGSRAALAEAGAAIQAARLEAQRCCRPPASAPGGNFSLCHGLAGVAELLLCAYETLGHDEHLHAARRVGDHGIAARARDGGWRCGLPEGGQAPGLMLGLAGIGACYLRLARPALMPPIGLIAAGLLSPPPASRALPG